MWVWIPLFAGVLLLQTSFFGFFLPCNRASAAVGVEYSFQMRTRPVECEHCKSDPQKKWLKGQQTTKTQQQQQQQKQQQYSEGGGAGVPFNPG